MIELLIPMPVILVAIFEVRGDVLGYGRVCYGTLGVERLAGTC
jgi:hypothetical protein